MKKIIKYISFAIILSFILQGVCFAEMATKAPINYYNLALTQYKAGKYADALKNLDKAIVQNNKNADAYYIKACILAIQNKSSDMLTALKKAIELNVKLGENALKEKAFLKFMQDKFFLDLSIQYAKKGNSTGNWSNSGLFARQGDWIYFSNDADENKIYKMKLDGSSVIKVADCKAKYLNVIGDWIYYSNRGDGDRICKVKVDGSGNIRINNDNSEYVVAVDDWLYYKNETDKGRLYKIRTDGSSKTALSAGMVYDINYADGYLYYRNYLKTDSLYRANSDGSGAVKISDDDSFDSAISDGWVYYFNKLDNWKIYKVKTDGTGRQKICDDKSDCIGVAGDWVYYSNNNDNNALYKIKTDGTGRMKLSTNDPWKIKVSGDWVYYIVSKKVGDDTLFNLNRTKVDGTVSEQFFEEETSHYCIDGDWIYYTNTSDDYKLYKIKTDKSNKMKLLDEDWVIDEIYVSGGYIYYCGSNIHKVRVDGSGDTKISDDLDFLTLYGVSDWIYCSDFFDENKPYRMKIDGSIREKLGDERYLDLTCVGENIFYRKTNEYYNISRMKVTDSVEIPVVQDNSKAFCIYNNAIYYINSYDSNKIYKSNADGTNKIRLSSDAASEINVSDGCIYYINTSDNNKIYKMNLDSSKREKLSDDWACNINVINDWVIYKNNSNNIQYRIKKDGTMKQSLIPGQTGISIKPGNNSGNIKNNGIITEWGDWIFYSNSNNDGKLFKIKKDGSNNTKLYDLSAELINASDDWIYFKNRDSSISRIKTDGSTRALILDYPVKCMYTVGDKIYFSTEFMTPNLIYSADLDGNNLKKLTSESVDGFAISNNWIYYINETDMSINKIRIDGSGKTKICEDKARNMIIDGDYIYYCNLTDGRSLYRIAKDGSGRSKLISDKVYTYNVASEWIYYTNLSDNASLYKIKIDGSIKVKMSEDKAVAIDILGDQLYYETVDYILEFKNSDIYAIDYLQFQIKYGDYYGLYKMKTDGTGRALVN